MGSRVVHAEDDVGGTVDYPLREWVCECGETGVRAVRERETDALEVYGRWWMRMGQSVRCKECPGEYRFSPTIRGIATPGQEVPKALRGESTTAIVDDDEVAWDDIDDEEDDIEWEDERDDPDWQGFSMHDYGDR